MIRELEYMTWLEARDAAKETDTVLIPIGALEPQGPHLPLGTDTLAAKYAALKLAEKANVVLAPSINFGYSGWFKGFQGLITIRKDTMTDLLRQYCRSLAESGFKRQLFLSPHLGNNDLIGEVGIELREEGVKMALINLWHATNPIAKIKNIDFKENVFTHAGEIMTSVMMVITPDSVKMNAAIAEQPKSAVPGCNFGTMFDVNFNGLNYVVYRFSGEDTKSGSYGDPMAATAEKGKQVIDGWLENITEFIENFQKY